VASAEFHALQERLAAMPPPPPPASLAELRDRIEANLGAQPLAPGVRRTDTEIGGVSCTVLEPEAGPTATVLYLHGGGYRLCSARSYAAFGSHLAATSGARVVVVDYRLAPEHRFPAAVEDAVAVYEALLAAGTAPGDVVVAGDSAGGGLTVALLLAARDRGLPLPAGGAPLSPWVDLTNSGASYRTRADADKLFSAASAAEAASLYLGDADPTDPLASPALGDLSGLPPLLVHVGDAEVLLDDARLLAERAEAAGVEVTLRVFDEMPHVWHISYPAFPEAVEAVEEVAAFVARVTGGA
jgi:epsilon-lactone hydrolase